MIGLNTEGSNEGLREEGSRVMFVFMKESILLFILTSITNQTNKNIGAFRFQIIWQVIKGEVNHVNFYSFACVQVDYLQQNRQRTTQDHVVFRSFLDFELGVKVHLCTMPPSHFLFQKLNLPIKFIQI